MVAWGSVDAEWYDRDEDLGQHVRVNDGWYEDCGIEDLCATIDRACALFGLLAGETAALASLLNAEPPVTTGDGQGGTDPVAARKTA